MEVEKNSVTDGIAGEEERLFTAVFESSHVGMVILGRDGRFLYANPAFSSMLGLDIPSIKQKKIFDFIPPDYAKHFDRVFVQLTEGKSEGEKIETLYMGPQDSRSWWTVNLSVQYYREGKRKFIFAVVEDSTSQRENRENLKVAKEMAEKSTRIKSDFLANMSHEIRTPIHTIMGMNDLLLETSLDPEQQEYAQQVRFSADVLLSLINDILDFSKIEAGKLNLEDIEIDLFSMTEDALDLVSLEAHKKGLEVALYIYPNVPHMLIGDPVRLRQIIMNLFNNAIKFTSRGEIIVTIEKVDETDDYVIIRCTVRDTGIGIPRDKVDRLFKAFSQVDTSTSRKYGGTGLGLSICKNLAGLMGGQIGVESEEGRGSSFWFTARLMKQDDPSIYSAIPEDFFEEVPVLIVDDNDTSRTIIGDYLGEWGCSVDYAVSGAEALEKLRSTAGGDKGHQICLVDLLMPGMDGWQLASEINADKDINSTKLVLMSPTGKSGDEAKMKLLRWYDAYLNKPIRKQELFECLFKTLNDNVDLEPVEDLEAVQNGTVSAEEMHGTALIAEDHEVNQQLFQTIMESLGWKVRLAENGKKAVELAKEGGLSIIFMDVQMPEMNGYEATEEIRASGIELPIIAATANAIKSEKDRCLEAGMNDFLIKPFKKSDVVPLLEKWALRTPLPPSKAEKEAKEAKEGKEEQEEMEELSRGDTQKEIDGVDRVDELEEVESLEEPDALEEADADAEELSSGMSEGEEAMGKDRRIFDFQSAVETFMGKEDVVSKVLNSFIDKVEGQIPAIEKALAEKDFESLREEAHSIKGGGWNLEVQRLGDGAAELEQDAKDQNLESAQEHFELCRKEFDDLKEFARKEGLLPD